MNSQEHTSAATTAPPRNLAPRPAPTLLSIVIPVYNEQESLPHLRQSLESLATQLPCPVEWILVNDGSRDQTRHLLLAWARTDDRLHVVDFARNFGHQAALTAGLDHAAGDAVAVMDADLQDPPELILDMLTRYCEGYDIAYAQRTRRHGETFFKRATASGFYWLMRKFIHHDLPANTGDFRLMSRDAVNAIRHMREGQRFLRGMITWIGFAQIAVPFERPPRVAGETKFSAHKMLAFAWDAIISFSSAPLQVAMTFGTLVFFFGLGYAGYAFFRAMMYGDLVPGWATLVILQCLIGGSILLCLGIIGEYIGRIYEEIKGRPIYIVRELVNFTASPAARTEFEPPRAVKSMAHRHGENR
ncbi:MAG: glycosyltransferase family 2 protein [Blastocatellia bacterium]